MEDLIAPGAEPGTMPTDWEQATGLERLEILGKMQGIDIFDMRPLDASRKGKSSPPKTQNLPPFPALESSHLPTSSSPVS